MQSYNSCITVNGHNVTSEELTGCNDDIITLLCVLIGLTEHINDVVTDLVEDGQVLTLQDSGFMGETWRTDRQTDR